jgi:hypothetical protein
LLLKGNTVEGFCPNCLTEVAVIEHSHCEVCGAKLTVVQKPRDTYPRRAAAEMRRIYAELSSELQMLSDDAPKPKRGRRGAFH